MSAEIMFVIAVSVLLGGFVHGAIGYGVGLVVLPIMAFAIPDRLPQVILLIAMPTVVWMAFQERRHLDIAAMSWLLSGRLVGTFGGVYLVTVLSGQLLQLTFGVATLLTAAAMALSGVSFQITRSRELSVGFVSGVMATTAGIGGPPVAVFYSHRSGPHLRATMAAVLLLGNLMSLGGLAFAGRLRMVDFAVSALLLLPLAAGLALSRRAIAFVDAGRIRPAVLTVSTVAAVILIIQSIE
jgi:uncharacterized protein